MGGIVTCRWRVMMLAGVVGVCIFLLPASTPFSRHTLGGTPGGTLDGRIHSTIITDITRDTNLNNKDELGASSRSRDSALKPEMGLGNSEYKRPVFQHSNDKCSQDGATYGSLRSLHTTPYVQFAPAFNASVFEYYVTVGYDVIALNVKAIAHHCNCEARVESKENTATSKVISVGLGDNEVPVLVVDVTRTPNDVISVYMLHVYRTSPGEHTPVTADVNSTLVCELIQDEEMPFDKRRQSGLHVSTSYTRWSLVTTHAPSEHCTSGDDSGRWLVPCKTCSDRTSCQWRRAVWRPLHCRHGNLSRAQLGRCLANRKIMFVGDSTNRGLMHYVIEKVNGSLTHWDKTHDVTVYSHINSNNNNSGTSLAFAYYPQFWRSDAERPTLQHTIEDLIHRMEVRENSEMIVLVLGGVHWLTPGHLHTVSDLLHRLHLDKILVVVKSLSAGFLQSDSKYSQSSKLQQNNNLMTTASRLGFKRLNTFNMTLARFKDFYPGSCSCHFHRIRESLPPFSDVYLSNDVTRNLPITYHVDGDVNAAYADILISQICSQTAKPVTVT